MRILLLYVSLGVLAVAAITPTAEERYNFFNIDLLQAVHEEVEGNVILSPASAKLALTTLAEGTAGRTRQEILSTLRLPNEESTIRRVVQRTLIPLKNTKNGTEINVATRMWTRPDLQISTAYANALQQYYAGDVRSINFADTFNSARTINEWVSRNTRDKIKSLVEPGTIDPDTRLMLTSALYFKGKWMKSFDRKATRVRCFNVPNKGCQDVHLMESLSTYRYAYVPSLDADVVEIPYSDGKTSMLILLPSQKENDQNLQILSRDLSYVPMSAILASLEETEILLVLPRFSIESKLDLRSPLMRMGIHDVFEMAANLSGISSNVALRVSNILQNAKIEVDEDGTVAAAVTGVSVIPLMGSTIQAFRADRPFIFAIVDLETNGTLFAGRFMQPDAIR